MSITIVARKEAKAQGLSRYFTGKPCKRGHVSQRYTSCAWCVTCAEEDHQKKTDADRTIARARASMWYYSNSAKANANSRRWAAQNPIKRLSIARSSYIKNREHNLVAGKLWRQNNIEKSNAIARSWRHNNPDKRVSIARKWRRENPDAVKAATHARRARKRNASGKYTVNDIRQIYIEQNEQCPYCAKELNGRYQIDHIIPLSRGGTNYPSNIQLLCTGENGRGGCNQRKGSKHPAEFAKLVFGDTKQEESAHAS